MMAMVSGNCSEFRDGDGFVLFGGGAGVGGAARRGGDLPLCVESGVRQRHDSAGPVEQRWDDPAAVVCSGGFQLERDSVGEHLRDGGGAVCIRSVWGCDGVE